MCEWKMLSQLLVFKYMGLNDIIAEILQQINIEYKPPRSPKTYKEYIIRNIARYLAMPQGESLTFGQITAIRDNVTKLLDRFIKEEV